MNLYLDYWVPDSNKPNAIMRVEEIKYAISSNVGRSWVTRVMFLTQEAQAAKAFVADLAPALAEKVSIHSVANRPTFQQFFDLANKNTDSTAVHVLLNNDIVLTESFSKLSTMLQTHDFFCITRYILVEPCSQLWQLDPHKEYSQDVWSWQGQNKITNANFEMGQIRCDHCLAYTAATAGYLVSNPALTLQARHMHMSNYRTYSKAGMLTLPGKLTPPTSLLKKESHES